jgi:hypothetical protein
MKIPSISAWTFTRRASASRYWMTPGNDHGSRDYRWRCYVRSMRPRLSKTRPSSLLPPLPSAAGKRPLARRQRTSKGLDAERTPAAESREKSFS